MKIALSVALSFLLFSTVALVLPAESVPKIPDTGICVVEFNAQFNASNSVPWVEDINDCSSTRIDIGASPELQRDHKISS